MLTDIAASLKKFHQRTTYQPTRNNGKVKQIICVLELHFLRHPRNISFCFKQGHMQFYIILSNNVFTILTQEALVCFFCKNTVETDKKLRQLEPGKAIVVCDYMMKLLLHKFREPQRDGSAKKVFLCMVVCFFQDRRI